MAKRRRLDVSSGTVLPKLETKSAVSEKVRIPIAAIAGDTADQAAFEEVVHAMTAAEEDGRIVKILPLDKVEIHHISRDRLVLDEEELSALIGSIEARGQQTPIEVLPLPEGRFGLISGLRRMEALQRLGRQNVLALIRRPENSQAAYQGMVEENEIRSGLSFYERAHIAVASVEQGVFPTPRAAVGELFAHAPKARRSKILKFVTICEILGPLLRYPAAIPEHLGLKLAQVLEDDTDLADRLRAGLGGLNPRDAAEERAFLEGILRPGRASKAKLVREIEPGLRFQGRTGRVVVSGSAVDEAFLTELAEWLKSRRKDQS